MKRAYIRVAVAAAISVALLTAATNAFSATAVTAGKTITHVNVVRETSATATSSTAFVNVPGATTSISVPSGESALLLLRFSAESACSGGGTSSNWCSLRILVDGAEAQPAAGLDFAFDSTNGGAETPSSWESHSMDRSVVVAPGTHIVRVQEAVTSSTTVLRLDDWSLTVERSQV